MKTSFFLHLTILIFILAANVNSDAQTAENADIKVYALDGGHLYFKDMEFFYDTGEHYGEAGDMAVPCYLIKHGKNWLLWDTGNGDDIASHSAGVQKLGIKFTVLKTLVSQLLQLGLKPSDIR